MHRQRAAQKAASRAADAKALASGAKSRDQLRRENGLFSAIPKEEIVVQYLRSRAAC